MGMFSWECKGCGHEMHGGELVRMNGHVCEYDGYGNGHNDEPICWHEICFQRANEGYKRCKIPSKHGNNQGFGMRALEFMEGYDPDAKTLYTVEILVTVYEKMTSTRHELYLTPSGLVDKRQWLNNYEEENVKLDFHDVPNMSAVMNDEEYEAYYLKREDTVEKIIGPNPERVQIKFSTFLAAEQAAEEAIKKLPTPEKHGWDLDIIGHQKNGNKHITGAVFSKNCYVKSAGPPDYKPTGEMVIEKTYEIGLPVEGHVVPSSPVAQYEMTVQLGSERVVIYQLPDGTLIGLDKRFSEEGQHKNNPYEDGTIVLGRMP